MEQNVWYRVINRFSPLYGCDVFGYTVNVNSSEFLLVRKLRKIDVVVGDRPLQLVSAPEEDLGILIDMTHVEISPIQDDVVEISSTLPHGKCLDEVELVREDLNAILRCAFYEDASQISLEDNVTGKIFKKTFTGENHGELADNVILSFDTAENTFDDIVSLIYSEDN